jgi:hypothetical protein
MRKPFINEVEDRQWGERKSALKTAREPKQHLFRQPATQHSLSLLLWLHSLEKEARPIVRAFGRRPAGFGEWISIRPEYQHFIAWQIRNVVR